MVGRVFVKENLKDNHLLIGASVGTILKPGKVYDIRETPHGTIELIEIGSSLVNGEDCNRGSIDKLLATSEGRHCLVAGES